MKTIVENDTLISWFIFADNDTVEMALTHITCPAFIISCFDDSTATLINDVTAPSDWESGKYLFDDSVWTLNSEWHDPAMPEKGPHILN
jgi:hypothetical protein